MLLDVQMPEMDGLEAARHIHAEWPREKRPYLAQLTAAAMKEDRDQCLAAGMDAYWLLLSKTAITASGKRRVEILFACLTSHFIRDGVIPLESG